MAKTLHLDFLNNPSLTDHTKGTATPDLSLTRTTKRRMVAADGYLRELQAGEAAFTGATFNHNLLRQSQTFDTTWVPGRATASPDATTAPDGTTTADEIVEDATATNTHYLRQAVTIDAGKSYTLSVYAKANTRSFIWMGHNIAAPTNGGAYFNLSAGTAGTAGSGVTAAISDEGDGWYRCSVTQQQANIATTTYNCDIGLAESDGGAIYSGDGASSAYYWGATLEVADNRTTPGTYVATTTAAVSSLTGTSTKGLLVEEARTNICKQSEDFTFGATWGNSGNPSVINVNQTAAPDGATTADQIIDNAATGTGAVAAIQTVTVSTSTAYTYSIFAKEDQLSWLALGVVAFTTPADSFARFNLSTGAVGTVGAGFSDSGIEDYGNGWYRCWVTFTTDGTDTSGQLRLYVADADGSGAPTVDLDGTSSIFIWGAQLEAGTFPLSYIPTTTTSVTRNADAITTTDVTWYADDDTGTLYTRAAPIGSVGGSQDVVALCNGTFQESHYHYFSTTATVANGRDGNVNQYTIGSSAGEVAVGTFTRMVSAWAVNDAAAATNGSLEGTDNSVSLPTITELSLGTDIPGFSGNSRHCHIAEIAYFNERLPNATLVSYTANGLPTVPTGFLYPRDAMPTDEARFHTYITESGVTQTGDLQTDYRNAMASALGVTPSNNYSLNDLAKRLDEQ